MLGLVQKYGGEGAASPLDAPLLAMKQVFRGPFLESPANFSGTKSNFQIEI